MQEENVQSDALNKNGSANYSKVLGNTIIREKILYTHIIKFDR